ncbi:MAG: DUF2237 domain-containing protein [Geminicoccaceae bacterium]|nr:DUF2237 domain-containing protein [Geminicoccaceae bacterium]
MNAPALNVLGRPLAPCGLRPRTGWFRDGCCRSDPADRGMHWVCAVMTREFLEFTRRRGNDLLTPRPELDFPGLRPGDRWCLCAPRWLEACEAGVAPPVILEATHVHALGVVPLALLEAHRYRGEATLPPPRRRED